MGRLVLTDYISAGKRLSGSASDTRRLRLADSRTVGDDGVQLMVYERVAP
jgi:hypothetical protein